MMQNESMLDNYVGVYLAAFVFHLRIKVCSELESGTVVLVFASLPGDWVLKWIIIGLALCQRWLLFPVGQCGTSQLSTC